MKQNIKIRVIKCDERNSQIISRSHMGYIFSNNDRHPGTKTLNPVLYTFRHFPSSNLNFTQLHVTTLNYSLLA